jgi:hypothetical protein
MLTNGVQFPRVLKPASYADLYGRAEALPLRKKSRVRAMAIHPLHVHDRPSRYTSRMSILGKITEKLQKASIEASRVDWKKGASLIDSCESFFVEEMGEIGYLQLVIVLVEGKAQAEVPIRIEGLDLGVGRPIRPDDFPKIRH